MSELKECQGCGSSTDNALFSVRLSGFCSNSCRIKKLQVELDKLRHESHMARGEAVRVKQVNEELRGENVSLVKRWAYMKIWLAIETTSDTSKYSPKALNEVLNKMEKLEGGK